ncbi:MAG: 50S ribosomal protein L10 [Candidatus Omnitrophica bacterium]|nr:50S ribosomal protein L10 [Candidatus Omnitrophota bacterium]
MNKWTKKRKEEIVKKLTEEFKNSKINILSSFSGLSVFEMKKIRDSIKNVGGNIMVVKNNLIEIIFKNLSKDQACKFINGPTFVVWSNKENEIEIIKSLIDFQKNIGKIEIKGGVLNGEIIDNNKLTEIGKLPSKKELQSQILYLLKMPSIRLVNSMRGPIRKLVSILNQIKEKKES